MRKSLFVTVSITAMAFSAVAVAQAPDRNMDAVIHARSDILNEPGDAARVEGLGATQTETQDPRMDPLGVRDAVSTVNQRDGQPEPLTPPRS